MIHSIIIKNILLILILNFFMNTTFTSPLRILPQNELEEAEQLKAQNQDQIISQENQQYGCLKQIGLWLRFPIILDMVEDNVHSRCLTVIALVLTYIYLAFTIIGDSVAKPQVIQEIKQRVALSDVYRFSQKFETASPYPRLQLLVHDQNEETRFQKINVSITVSDFVSDQVSKASRDCNYQTRFKNVGTLEAFRLYDVCRVQLEGFIAESDPSGVASFQQFSILTGPQGRYQFSYSAVDPETKNIISSIGFSSYLETTVATIKSLNLPPALHIQIEVGKPLRQQPAVQLLDINGNPVQGKRVIAFTWHEPTLVQADGQPGLNYFPYRSKYALLSGHISEPSNSSGIAQFTNLTIEAHTWINFYMYFQCENVAFTIYGYNITEIVIFLGKVPYQMNFIQAQNIGKQMLSIQGNYSLEVVEGEVLKQPIVLKFEYIQGNKKVPIEGAVIIVTIQEAENSPNIDGYFGFSIGTRLKDIIKPISANYSDDLMNPFSQQNPIQEILRTNSSGYIVMDQFYFSIYGNIDKFKLSFWSNGTNTISDYIQVKSSIDQIKILSQPEKIVDYSISDTIGVTYTLQILNKQQLGVPGKQAIVRAYDSSTNIILSENQQFKCILNASSDGYSDYDGILVLNILFYFVPTHSITVYLIAEIDGILSPKTQNITFLRKFFDTQTCGNIYYVQKPPDQIDLNQVFNFSIKVVDTAGNPMKNQDVYVYGQLDYEGVQYTEQFIPWFYNTNSPFPLRQFMQNVTDEDGMAYFINYQLVQGITGSFNLFALTTCTNKLKELTQIKFENFYYLDILALICSRFARYHRESYNNLAYQLLKSISEEDGNKYDQLLIEFFSKLNQQIVEEGNTIDPFNQDSKAYLIKFLQDLMQVCEADKLKINYIYPINLILQDFLDETDVFFKQNDTSTLLMIFLDNQLKPIRNSTFYAISFELQVLINPDSEQWQEDKSQFFKFTPNSLQTDENGFLFFNITYLKSTVGIYVINLRYGPLCTQAVGIIAYNPVEKIEIIQQPDSNQYVTHQLYEKSDPIPQGDIFSGFIVRVHPIKNPLNTSEYLDTLNLTVILSLDTDSDDSQADKALIDLGDSFRSLTQITSNSYRTNFTQSDGLVYFDQVSVSQVRDQKTCVRFVFVVGDGLIGNNTGLMRTIKSQPTNLYCFRNNMEVTIINKDQIDQTISPFNVFTNPIKIQVKIKKLSFLQMYYQIQFSYPQILVSVSFYELIDSSGESKIGFSYDSKTSSTFFLQNWFCSYYIPTSSCQRSTVFNEYGEYQLIQEYTFNNLMWKLNKEATIIFSVSDSTSANNKQQIQSLEEQFKNYFQPSQLHLLPTALKNTFQGIQNQRQYQNYMNLQQNINNTLIMIKLAAEKLLGSLKGQEGFQTLNDSSSVKTMQFETLYQLALDKDPNNVLSFLPLIQEINNRIELLFTQFKSIIGLQSSDETNPIRISIIPSSIQFIVQPPSRIYVGDIIQIKVYLTSLSFAVSNQLVEIGIIKKNFIAESPSILDTLNMMQDLEASSGNILNMQSYMSIGQGAVLDPQRTQQRTNQFGLASFNLKFIAGQTQFLSFSTSSSGIGGQESTSFLLLNHILEVSIPDGFSTILVKDMVETNIRTAFQSFPNITLIYEQGFTSYNYPKNVQFIFYYYQGLENTQTEIDKDLNQTKVQINNSLTQIGQQMNSLESTQGSVKEKLMQEMSGSMFSSFGQITQSLKRAIMSGGKLFYSKITSEVDLIYDFDESNIKEQLIDVKDSKIVTALKIKDLRINFYQLGIYQFQVSVDGILSKPSGPIYVKRKMNVADQSVIDPIVGGLIFGIFGLVVLINIIPKELTRFLTGQLNFKLMNRIKFVLHVFVLGLSLSAISIIATQEVTNREQTGQDSFSIKNFMYYLAFVLCLGISFNSLFTLKLCNLDSDSFFETKMKNMKSYLQHIFKVQIVKSKQILKELLVVILPFLESNGQQVMYPQRLMAASLISFFSVIYVIYVISLYVYSTLSNMEKQTMLIEEGFSQFISAAVNNMKILLNLNTVLEDTYAQLLQPVKQLTDIILSLKMALNTSFIFSTVLAFITYVLNQYCLFYDFRKRILAQRKGHYDKDEIPNKLNIAASAFFIGAHVSVSVIGMAFILIVCTLAFSVVFYKYTWLLLFELKLYILTIILTPIIQAIIKYLVNQTIYFKGLHIRNRFLLSVIELIFLYVGIAGSIFGALARSIIMMVFILFNITVSYRSIYPVWINNLSYSLDAVSFSYLSSIRMFQIHNNPIAAKFENFLNNFKSLQNTKQTRIKNKINLMLLLHKRSSLRSYRKQQLNTKQILDSKKNDEKEQILNVN